MFCSECGLLLLSSNLFNSSNVNSVYFFSNFLPLEIVFPQLGTALELDLKQLVKLQQKLAKLFAKEWKISIYPNLQRKFGNSPTKVSKMSGNLQIVLAV